MQKFTCRYTVTFSFDEVTSYSSHNLDEVNTKAEEILKTHQEKTGSRETAYIFDGMWKIFEITL